ncbi:MAG TPA: hypothetical protein VL383_04640, partial [Gemmatimonadaceae bacterium]|nr:hypothetical protein [Gemmatimonadaceae bacterium]
MRTISLIVLASSVFSNAALAQGRGGRGNAAAPAVPPVLLVPDRVWNAVDDAPHDGWAVLVRGDRIEAVGPRAQITVPAD